MGQSDRNLTLGGKGTSRCLCCTGSYRVVSQTFNIPKISVHDIVFRVSKAVLGILRSVICSPTGDDLEAVRAGFAQVSGSPAFSSAVGAIDGCHIRMKPPAIDSHCYFSRKLFHSIQLQDITDHQGKFIDIFVGYPCPICLITPYRFCTEPCAGSF